VAERVNFYLDEHVPRAVVSGLRRRRVDVLTLQEAGCLGPRMKRIWPWQPNKGGLFSLKTPISCGCTLPELSTPGIVYVPQHTPVGYILRGLMLIYEVLEPEDMKNRLEFL
jgi:hypothetical protein